MDIDPLTGLLQRAAAGDTDAFSALVKALQKPTYHLAFSLLGNRADAEDLTQEAFLRLWRSRTSFRFDASVSTYLFSIVRNLSIDFLRKQKNRPAASLVSTDRDGTETEAELPDTSPDSNPSEAYIRQERIRGVRQAIADLPPEQRILLTLRDMDGYSYQQIGELLSLEEGTVKSRLFRARQALKKLLIERKIY